MLKTPQKTKKVNNGLDTAPLPNLPGLDDLGCGYDVTGEYANQESVKLRIIDKGPNTGSIVVEGKEYAVPENLTIDVHPMDTSLCERVTGKSISEYREDLNNKTKIKGSTPFFSGSLEVDFDMSEMENSSNEFSTVRNVIKLWTMNLPDQATLPILPTALADIDGTTGLTPTEVFDKYGTHFVWEIIVGGRLDYSSSTNKMTFNQNYDIGVAAEMSYKSFNGSISASQSSNFAQEIEEFNSSSNSECFSEGGNPALGAQAASGGITAFNDWTESVLDQPVMIDFTEDSLIPIWGILEAGQRKTELEDYYDIYLVEKYKEIVPNKPIVDVVFTPDLQLVATDTGSGADKYLAVYKPTISPGYFWLGQYAQGDWNTPNGNLAMVKPITEGSTAPPLSFNKIWDDKGSGNSNWYSCWKPVPPVGYVSLGYIMRLGVSDDKPPSGDEIKGLVCVHESLVTEGQAKNGDIWNDKGTGADKGCSIYNLIGSTANGLDVGTFYAQGYLPSHNPNPTNPPAYCLDISKTTISSPSDKKVEVAFAEGNNLALIATDSGSGSDDYLAVYKPKLLPGFSWLGQYAQSDWGSPYGRLAMIKPRVGEEASVAPPTSFTKIWDDKGSGNSKWYSCWKPVPPAGYVALGYIMRLGVSNDGPPTSDEIKNLVCVHESLVVQGKAQEPEIWDDKGSGADNECRIFNIIRKTGDGLDAGTFYGQNNYRAPNPTNPPVYCLDISKIQAPEL